MNNGFNFQIIYGVRLTADVANIQNKVELHEHALTFYLFSVAHCSDTSAKLVQQR